MNAWAHPWALPLMLLGLGCAFALHLWWRTSLQRRYVGIGAGQNAHQRVSQWRSRLRSTLLWSGLVALAFAVAGPRWGSDDEERQVNGIDLLIAIDCSRSMLAQDLFPDRSHAARDKAVDLVRELADTRVALLPFAGIATLRCPLTSDQIAVARMLEDCTPDFFPAKDGLQGTAIGAAVQTGVEILGRDAGRGQAILVISDGVDTDQAAVSKASDLATKAGIPVYGLFIGDDSRSASITVDGKQVAVAADRHTLDDLARATSAICVNHTTTPEDIQALATHLLDNLVRSPWEERRRVVQQERYRWALLPAIALLSLGFLMPTAGSGTAGRTR